ncbi:hypothetical protein DQW50_07630 [Halorubrum sp. 48-1-W]|uniref:hypothetical protein n=1 Tax=Halorubrum sp. 48-1-W TaxID=2249761 RepID=UPI000DCE88A5|nr:hypothetical protein [Halorubrum sp. 48-1-W]RAW45617.1 hypothetical protein DQW50_07630 [Halorubrum sp. 48-1-W]
MDRRALLGSLAAGFGGSVAGCGGRAEDDEEEDRSNGAEPNGSDSSNPEPSEPEPEPENRWERLQEEFGFEERLDAVEDLGWDPEGDRRIDPWLVRSFERDALIEVPPGRYKIAGSISVEELSNWGLAGLGEDRTDVKFVTTEGSRIEFKVQERGTDLLFENFSFDLGEEFDRSMGMTFFVDDNLQIHNVEKAGANPTSDPDGVSALLLNVVNPDGRAVVDRFVRTGPQVFAPYPNNELCVYSGHAHVGTVTYRNLDIRNAGENGIYASKGPGDVHVEGGFYKNNRNDAVRISGDGSYIRDATIVIDSDDFHPDNRGVEENMRGIRMQSGEKGYTGGLIEDTELELRSTFVTQALVQISHNQGGMTMRDSTLRNWTRYPSFRAVYPSEYVESPWNVELEDVQFSEYGSTGPAVEIMGRPNSTLRNVSVVSEREFGARRGIDLVGCGGTAFEDVTVRTNGIPLRIERPSGSLEDYAIEFGEGNEFSMNGGLGPEVTSRFGVSEMTGFDLTEDRTVFPFRDVDDDVAAAVVTSVDDDSVRFGHLRG